MTNTILDVNTVFGLWPRREVDTSLPTLLRIQQRAGITAMCALSTRGIFYDAVAGNDETLAASKENPSILPVATLDLRELTDLEAEIRKRKDQGFRFIRLFREYQGWPMDYRPFNDLLRALEHQRLPLYVTITALGDMTRLGKSLWGCTFPVIVGGVNASFAPLFAEAISVAALREALYFDTARFDSVDAYEIFAEKLGPSRLVFGSGAPLCYAESALNALQTSALKPKDKKMVLHENLERVLHGG